MNVIVEMKRDDLQAAIAADRLDQVAEALQSEYRQNAQRWTAWCLVFAALSDGLWFALWLTFALLLSWRWYRSMRRTLDKLHAGGAL